MPSKTISDVRGPDGFAAISDYGVIGDGRSIALVGRDGALDWWGVPEIDSPPPFAAVLDPAHGGSWRLRPTDADARTTWRYLPHTNQLETTFTTATGEVTMLDSLNAGNAGALPWVEFARRLDATRGSVEMALDLVLGSGLGTWQPWLQQDERGIVLHAGNATYGLRHTEGMTFQVGRADVRSTFTIREGRRMVVALVASDSEPLYLADVDTIDRRIEVTSASWRQWAGQVQWEGAGREAIVRSALALKLLMVRTGAIAAAATTSLPERVGGDKNWDYRFSWIRDAALTIDAMAMCGLQEEVHSATAWLLRSIRENGPDVHVMYTLDGQLAESTREPDVPGYRDSRPAMIGNGASSQTQLGIYGDLFQTVARWVFRGHVLDTGTARQLADLADRCADEWLEPDAGIWELSEDRQYTSSKMNCWRALTCAARLAEDGHIPGPVERWKQEAERIRSWVDEHCWSARKSTYTFFAGSEDLDASVLLAAQFDFDTGEKMSSTIDALCAELSAGPLLYRYSGADKEEGTFLACAFWHAEALARVGRRDEAASLLAELDGVSSDLGLLSEMAAAGSSELLGNIPQALSHLAHISASFAVRNPS